MIDIEKDGQKQDDNSTNSNSENDFKELDNEIDKVVRGETSFEEEKLNDNSDEDSNSNKKNIQNSSTQKQSDGKNANLDINNSLNKANILKFLYQIKKENILALEQYKKNLIIDLMNSEANQFNNYQNDLNINNIQNNYGFINNIGQNEQIKNHINNSYYYNNMNNNEINNDINQNQINSYLKELISLYNNSFNNCNDNINYYISNSNINCNNNVNNIVQNNIINTYIQPQNVDDFSFNNNKLNILPDLCNNNNNFMCNYMNNLNHNCGSLNPVELKMKLNHLYSNNINEANQNLFLLNQINNKNKLCINNNLVNNNSSQIDLNFFNINNININNRAKTKYESFPIKNGICNATLNKSIQKKNSSNKEEENNNQYKKKSSNQKSDLDASKNIINLLEVFLCKDRRTTLMIKNIPNKYTISSFLEEINLNFKFTYDIFYLPIDYVNKCNLGFAFINFVEPFHIILFYELYRGKKWKKFNSDKICELLYAKFQGKKELITHFEKGKVLSMESEEKRPLILPTPNPFPKISLPLYYLELFIKIYPNISYEIKDCKNRNNNNNGNKKKCSPIPIFTIKGNFLSN